MRTFVLASAAVLVFLTGCGQPDGTPGVSVSPPQAMQMWQSAPDRVHILDVRTPAEYVFVGHAPMARNIPVKYMANQWNADQRKPVFKPSPTFVDDVKKVYKPDDTILVMCSAGTRSKDAAKLMKDAGYKDVRYIEGGFEGERGTGCSDHGSGALIKPGWKNCGLVWTWALDPDVMYLPEGTVTTKPAGKP